MNITQARPASGSQFAFVEGTAVFLDARTGTYVGANRMSTEIFEFLLTNPEVDSLVAHLLDRYDVSEDVLRRDVQRLLHELAQRGIVVVEAEEPE